MELQKEEQISINHIFDDYKSFLDYLLEHDDENKINGVSEEFLEKHYNNDIMRWYEDNNTNEQCFNCKNCNHCKNCSKCFDCGYCENCDNCEKLKDSIDCEDCLL